MKKARLEREQRRTQPSGKFSKVKRLFFILRTLAPSMETAKVEEKGTEQEPFLFKPTTDYLISGHVLIEDEKRSKGKPAGKEC